MGESHCLELSPSFGMFSDPYCEAAAESPNFVSKILGVSRNHAMRTLVKDNAE